MTHPSKLAISEWKQNHPQLPAAPTEWGWLTVLAASGSGTQGPTHPGFISSQASSCPALGASVPVRIFPLSTWITFTGRSLIWLVSSRGWKKATWATHLRCSLTMANWGRALPTPYPQNGTPPRPVAVKWVTCILITQENIEPIDNNSFFEVTDILVFIFKWVIYSHSSKFKIIQSGFSLISCPRARQFLSSQMPNAISFSGILPDQFHASETRTGFSSLLHKWLS